MIIADGVEKVDMSELKNMMVRPAMELCMRDRDEISYGT